MPLGIGRKQQPTEPAPDPSWHRVGDGLAADLLSRGGATTEAIAAAEQALGTKLPPSLAQFVAQADAAEGWVAGDYLALWPVDQLADLNTRAKVAEFAPNLVAFATNAGGEGYFFDRTTGEFINSPMIGLGYIDPTMAGRDFEEFLAWLAKKYPRSGPAPAANISRFGRVIHEIHPILLGGSPTDPKNKTFLPLPTYADAVALWNDRVLEARNGMANSTSPTNKK